MRRIVAPSVDVEDIAAGLRDDARLRDVGAAGRDELDLDHRFAGQHRRLLQPRLEMIEADVGGPGDAEQIEDTGTIIIGLLPFAAGARHRAFHMLDFAEQKAPGTGVGGDEVDVRLELLHDRAGPAGALSRHAALLHEREIADLHRPQRILELPLPDDRAERENPVCPACRCREVLQRRDRVLNIRHVVGARIRAAKEELRNHEDIQCLDGGRRGWGQGRSRRLHRGGEQLTARIDIVDRRRYAEIGRCPIVIFLRRRVEDITDEDNLVVGHGQSPAFGR